MNTSSKERITEFMNEIEKELELTNLNLEKKLYKVPTIHSNILRKYFKAQTYLVELETQLAKKFKEKWHYYAFDYEYKLDSDKKILFYIEADEEYAALKLIVAKQKILCDFLEKSVRKAASLTYDVKNIIEYLKFMNGN